MQAIAVYRLSMKRMMKRITNDGANDEEDDEPF